MNVKPFYVVLMAVMFAAVMFGVGGSLPYAFFYAYPGKSLALVGLIAAVIYALSQTKLSGFKVTIGDKTRSLTHAFLAATGVSAVCYLILSGIFGSTLQPVDSWQEVKHLLTDPSTIRAEMLKAVLVISASWCLFWIWFKSEHKSLWLFKTAFGVCVFFLLFPQFNPMTALKQGVEWTKELKGEIAPAPSESVQGISQEAKQRLADAEAAKQAWETSKQADRIMARVGIHDIVVIPQGLEVWVYESLVARKDAESLSVQVVGEDGHPTDVVVWLTNAEQPEIGSEWIVQRNILFWAKHSAMHYIQLVNRQNENLVRAIRSDYLEEIEAAQPQMTAPSSNELQLASQTQSAGLSSAVNATSLQQFVATEDVVTVTGDTWVKTEIYPEDGDYIDVRSADGSLLPTADLERIHIRSGNAALGELRPNFPSGPSQAYGLTRIYGDNPLVLSEDGNLTKACVRLKLSGPGQVQVKVTKLQQ